MGAIVALFQRDGAPVDEPVLQHMLDACPQRAVDGQAIRLGGEAGIAHQHFNTLPEDRLAVQPLADERLGLILAADVRLDNRADLLARLALPGRESDFADAEIVLHAYRRWGQDCPRHLLGDFAFVVWDGRQRELFAAVDQVGERSLCYTVMEHFAVVASDVPYVLAHPAVTPRLNEGKVADYLNYDWSRVEETYYQGILQLPPAHCLLISRERVRTWQYWTLDPERRIRYRSEGEYAEHLLSLLHEAVECRLRSTGPIGISLSGGLDSTAVAALAAPKLAERSETLHSFSYVFDEVAACDERQYIVPVVERYGLDATYLNGDRAWTLNRFHEWPVERDSIWHDPFYWLGHSVLEAAQVQGCRVLLTGDFGDSLFEGGHYWAADVLREARLADAARLAVRQRGRLAWRSQVWDAGVKALVPERVKRAVRGERREAAHGFPGFAPGFLERVRQGREPMQPVFRDLSSDRRVRIASILDHAGPQWAMSSRTLDAGFSLERISPLHDRRLVEFVTALPAYQLGRPGRTRWVMRNALASLLPQEVRERQDKTVFDPLLELGLRQRECGRLDAILRDPQVVKRGIVDERWLAHELEPDSGWTDGGLRLWLVACLELWLKQFW